MIWDFLKKTDQVYKSVNKSYSETKTACGTHSLTLCQKSLVLADRPLSYPLGKRSIKTSYLEESRNTWESAGVTCTAI